MSHKDVYKILHLKDMPLLLAICLSVLIGRITCGAVTTFGRPSAGTNAVTSENWGGYPDRQKETLNIVLSFSHDSVTTARLKTYNVHRAIGAQRARDQMGQDRQGRPKNKRSKKELGG
ncbi:hypothetical protein TNCV_4933921 [Trichonephila clavipes]|nr:hypothetical protein TNCV_4933921 [Trichonephila clavipes]